MEHQLTLTDAELREVYGVLKHVDLDYQPAAMAIWERIHDLWWAHRERINKAPHSAEGTDG